MYHYCRAEEMTELYSMHLRRASRELCLATPCTTEPSYFSSYCACVIAQKFRLYRRIDPRITQRNRTCYLRSKSHMFPEVGHYGLLFWVHLLEWKAELPPALCSAGRMSHSDVMWASPTAAKCICIKDYTSCRTINWRLTSWDPS